MSFRFTVSVMQPFTTVLFGSSEELTYGVGGLNADVIRFTILHCDEGSDEKRHLVKINQDVFEFI